MLLGRPQFSLSSEEVIQQPAFFKASYSVQHLRPSSYDPYSLWGRVQALFFFFLRFVTTPVPISIPTFRELATTSFDQKNEMLTLFSRSLSLDNPSLSTFAQCEELRTKLRNSLILDSEKRAKATVKLRDNFKNSVEKLPIGKSMLIPLSLRDDVNVFYLLEKKSTGYSLKVIGCDKWMEQLINIPPKKEGGKEKIFSQIAFKDIPASYFDEECIFSLFWDPLREGYFNTTQIQEKLAAIPAACKIDLTGRKELWVTKSSSSRKALALVERELNPVTSHEKAIRKRIEFKTRLFALFTFFKEIRFSLENDPSCNATLQHLVREVAKEASLLAKKGYLVEADLCEIQQELNFITKTIEESRKRVQVSSLHVTKKQQPFQNEAKIQPPVLLTEESFTVLKNISVVESLSPPVTCKALFTEEEKELMRGEDKGAVLKLLEQKKALAHHFASIGNRDLAVALVMELTQNLPLELLPNFSERRVWLSDLDLKEIIPLQGTLLDFTKLLVENRRDIIPLPNQAIVLLQLTWLSQWLYSPSKDGGKGGIYSKSKPIEGPIREIMNAQGVYSDEQGQSDLQRSFYLVDEENYKAIEFFHCLGKHSAEKFTSTAEERAQAKSYLDQQVQLFFQFYGVPSADLWSYKYKLVPSAFQAEQMQRYSKGIQNPLLMAALRQTELKGYLEDIIYKLLREGKIKSPSMMQGDGKPCLEHTGWKVTEVERDELQKDMDREQSLRQPEASSDDPERVFAALLDEMITRMKEYGAEGEYSLKTVKQDYTKGELSDLLYLLRKDSPQIEVFGFIRKHPHLLSIPDIRNYLEIVLFDVGGSYLTNTFVRNDLFMKSLPHLLQEEIDRFQELAKTDPKYYNQLLFICLLTRKLSNIYRIVGRAEKFPEIPNLREILATPSLQEFHFRAAFELLMNDLEKSKDPKDPAAFSEIVKLYHLIQSLPRKSHDVDPNEMDKLNRRYAALLLSFENTNAEEIAPLLDSRGTSRAVLPNAITTDPTYSVTFTDLDELSLQVRTTTKGEITIYLLSDKHGEKGAIEVEKGSNRFYKWIPDKQKNFQVVAVTDPLHGCLAGRALYFDPKEPNVALSLDDKWNIRFKILLNQLQVIDCRGEKESAPYDVQIVEELSQSGLENLTRFESGQNILVFSRNRQLEKVEFVRYGTSFTYREGKFYSDDARYSGYFIDLQPTENDLSYSLTLRHKERAKEAILILPEASTLKRITVVKGVNPSFLWRSWLLLRTWWTGVPPHDKEFQYFATLEGPQISHETVLESSIFHVRPYTKEIVVVDEEKKVSSVVALMEHALFHAKPDILLAGYKQLKLTSTDLTKENVTTLLHFLRTDQQDDGNSASIKIQIALAMKQLIGKKVQYLALSSGLDEIISVNSKNYLYAGKKIDQRFLLTEPELKWVAKIVHKKNLSFYQEHLHPFLSLALKENNSDYSAIQELSIEELEKIPDLKQTKFPLQNKGTAILFSEPQLTNYFDSSLVTLPIVPLPPVPDDAPTCEKRAVDKLKRDMKAYADESKWKHSLKVGQETALKNLIQTSKDNAKTSAETLRKKIDQQLLGNGDPTVELAIQGGLQKVSTFQEIAIAFMQRNLSSVDLPPKLNQEAFSHLLREYFIAETNYLLLLSSEEAFTKLVDTSLSADERGIQSQVLYELLARERFYSPETNPELLVHECFSQQIFRGIGSANQVQMVSNMLNNHNGVYQAPTGFGKTKKVSVPRGLLQANGTNLVTYRLLPTLLKQSIAVLQEELGLNYNKKITLLLFDLKMPLVIQ